MIRLRTRAAWRRAVCIATLACASIPALFAEEPPVDTAVDDRRAFVESMGRVSKMIELGDMKEATRILGEVIAAHPGEVEPQLMMGSLLITSGQYDEASRLMDDLLLHHPRDARLLNNYAWMLCTAGDPSFRDPARALELARDAILISPDDYHVWSTLAEAHYAAGNFAQAVKVLNECLALAARKNAGEQKVHTYRMQMQKMQEALSVMSLIE